MSADELINLINEDPRIQVIDSHDPDEVNTRGESDQQRENPPQAAGVRGMRHPDLPAERMKEVSTDGELGRDQTAQNAIKMPLEELRFNPGSPVLTLTQAVARVCELWPMRYAIYGSLRKLWERQKRRGMIGDAVWANYTNLCVEGIDGEEPNAVRMVHLIHVSDLSVAIIREGTTSWKEEACMLGEVLASEGLTEGESACTRTPNGKVNPLYTEEGAAVYWM